MIPRVGSIVHYTLTALDASEVNRRRKDAVTNAQKHRDDALGYTAHVGNQAAEGDVYPMLITRCWDIPPTETTSVNGQVFLDGNDSLWVTSSGQGYGKREWHERSRTLADL